MAAKQTQQTFAVVIIIFLLLSLITLNARSAAPGNLQVSFINVGQGDAALLRDANGFDVLIDGGQPFAGPTVVAHLRSQGGDGIDVMVASHADSDHIGGLIDVLLATDIPIQAVVLNGYPGTSVTWVNFIDAVSARGLVPTVAQFPAEYQWGEMSVHVLNPAPGLVNPSSNDASIVLRVDHGDVNFLFTGDISSAVEAQILERATPIAAEILKVAHHGSAYSSSPGFLSAAAPQESVISVGNNSYGHPAPEALLRLSEAKSAIWRTDRSGNILVVSDGAAYTITADAVVFTSFLPIILREPPVVLPTPVTPTAVTPTVETPFPGSGSVVIQHIHYDGSGSTEPDEFVEIMNTGSAVNLQGWTLRDNANHVYTFPAFTMQPEQVCRVYTNQYHPDSCGFSYASSSAIWNNTGDCAYLQNASGSEVSSICY